MTYDVPSNEQHYPLAKYRYAGISSLTSSAKIAGGQEGNFQESYEEAQFSLKIAKGLIDVGLSLTPGISVGKDAYEALTGKNLVTGDPLSRTERSMAIVGVVTLGTSNYGKVGIKAIHKLGKLARNQFGEKLVAKGMTKAVKEAEKVVDSLPIPVHGGAKNCAAFERYLRDMREAMRRPHVENAELFKLMEQQYRPAAKIGSGSTAAAIRYERATGELVQGKSHIQKGQDDLRWFKKWFENNSTASPGDRAAAENVIKDLEDSLKGLSK